MKLRVNQRVKVRDARGKVREGIYTGYSEEIIVRHHVRLSNGRKVAYDLKQIKPA
jgi:hypothetical protein